jgi:hypothetical protein
MNEFLLLVFMLALLSFLWALSEYFAVRRLMPGEQGGKFEKLEAEDEKDGGAYAARLEGNIESLRNEVQFLKEKLLEFSSFKEERKKNLTELNRISNKVNSALSKARLASRSTC